MTRDCATAIAAVLPGARVTLVGYCFGGLIAHATSEALPGAGIEVDGLVLLNRAPPGLRTSLPDERAVRLAEIFGDLPGIDAGSLKALPPDEQVRAVVARGRATDELPAGVDDAQARANVELMDNHLELELAYRPRSGGLVPLLVRARDDRRFRDGQPFLGWSSLAGIESQAASVPGDHESMLQEPHVHAVAACIDQWLAPAGGKADSPRVAGER